MSIPRAFSAPLLLILAAITLGAIISIELRARLPDSDAMVAVTQARPSAPAVPPTIVPPTAEQAGARVADILARPLFNPSRRPAAPVAAGPGSSEGPLPRMTGVVVSPAGSYAIFASGGSKPVVVEVGGRVGAYVVQSIEAGHVTLGGPEGRRVVAPAFDPKPPAPPAGATSGLPGLPNLTGLQGLTGIPGLGGRPPAPATSGSPGSPR